MKEVEGLVSEPWLAVLSGLNSDRILLRMLGVRTVLLSRRALKALSIIAWILGLTSLQVRASHMDEVWSWTEDVKRTSRETFIRSVLARRGSSAAAGPIDSLGSRNEGYIQRILF